MRGSLSSKWIPPTYNIEQINTNNVTYYTLRFRWRKYKASFSSIGSMQIQTNATIGFSNGRLWARSEELTLQPTELVPTGKRSWSCIVWSQKIHVRDQWSYERLFRDYHKTTLVLLFGEGTDVQTHGNTLIVVKQEKYDNRMVLRCTAVSERQICITLFSSDYFCSLLLPCLYPT